MEQSQHIDSLLKLLDDPDESIFNSVTSKLIDFGPRIIPELEEAWEKSLDQELQERIETIIQLIQFSNVKKNLKNWIDNGGADILEGVFYVASFQYPDLNFQEIDNKIEKIKKDIWLELNNNLTALEKVRIINYFLFDVLKFQKNTTNYYSPQNSFINQVLETKKGNAISLAVIYMSLANKLNIPIYGVNLPKNFILAYRDDYSEDNAFAFEDQIMFYINPFNKGAVLGKKEIELFLEQLKIEQKPAYFLPCNNVDIIKRILQNLVYSYELLGYVDKIERILTLLDVFE